MTWAQDIDQALMRCGSPHSAADVLRWVRDGQAVFAAGDHMHGSLWFRPDGKAEIGHVAGRWNMADAEWLFKRMRAEALARGIEDVEINGRPGWRRFLQQKGFEHGRRRRTE